jgi:hypothetical protein
MEEYCLLDTEKLYYLATASIAMINEYDPQLAVAATIRMS